MHIVGNHLSLSLSLSLSQISSRSLDGQHSQLCHLRERQQQWQPATTTNTGASVVHASSDVANHATNYGEHAASARTTISLIASVAQQAWRIAVDQSSNILLLCQANGCQWLVKGHWEETTSSAMHQQRKGSIHRLVGRVCWSPRGTGNYQLARVQE
jgi:hypothetical protein